MRRRLLAAVLTALTGSPTATAGLTPERVAFWTRVGSCETGGGGPPKWDWGAQRRPNEGSVYEGGVGFYWGSWQMWARELGLLARYPHAYMAPARVQMRVAQHGLEHGGYWGCLR